MSVKNRVLGFFRGKDSQVETSVSSSNNQPVTDQNKGSLSDLIVALDNASDALSKSSLGEEQISQYSTTLTEMKKEISGILDAPAIPELFAALEEVFSKTLLKAFLYGSAEQVDEVKSTVFNGIKALPGSSKEQQLATLDLDIATINGEIWEADYLIIVRQGELREKQQAMIDDPENIDLVKPVQMLAVQIKNLRQRNETAKTELEGILTRRRDIEADALGTSFRTTHERIASFIESLPSAVEQVKAIEEIEGIGDRNRARLASEINMLAQALGGIEDVLPDSLSESNKDNKAITSDITEQVSAKETFSSGETSV